MKKRILLISLAITVGGLSIMTIIFSVIFHTNLVDDAVQNLKTQILVYEENIEDYIGHTTAEAEKLSKILGGNRVTFISLSGDVLADSLYDSPLGNHADREEVKGALSSGEGFAVRKSSTAGQELIYFCKNIDGVLVRISSPSDTFGNMIIQMLPLLIIILIADVGFCMLLTYLSVKFVLRPVEAFSSAAAKNLKPRAPYEELEEVATMIAQMKQDAVAAQAEKTEMMERTTRIKNEFIANVTHEMNTPLTSISGFAELMKEDKLPKSKSKEAASIIFDQSEKLKSLVRSILNYSAIEKGETLEKVDLSAVVSSCIAAAKPAAVAKGIDFVHSVEHGLKIYSTPKRVSDVAENLISNALRYTPKDGKVEVALERSEGCFKLTVSDNGIGIEKEDYDKIFDRFYTADASRGGEGAGLGLAIVKRTCFVSGWHVSVTSEKGKGSIFTVLFIL